MRPSVVFELALELRLEWRLERIATEAELSEWLVVIGRKIGEVIAHSQTSLERNESN